MDIRNDIYQSLDNQRCDIRLLRLKAGTSREIEGELIYASLDDGDIQYEAVSYTWGNLRDADTISLDGRKLPITLHLSLWLRDLRSEDTDRILWIDAICINQQDKVERGSQVQMMKRIFNMADQVLFCVARPTEMTDFFMMALQELHCERSDQHTKDQAPLSEVQWRSVWNNVQMRLEEIHFSVQQRLQQGLEYILDQSWFHRVWILQEVANARTALLHVGTKSVSTEIFAASPYLLEIQPREHCSAVLDLMPGGPKKYLAYDSDLYSLLKRFRSAEATEEHDKTFALLGMRTDPTPDQILQANYEKSVHDIIRDTIAHICHCDAHSIRKMSFNSMEHFLGSLETLDNEILLLLLKMNDPANAESVLHNRKQNISASAAMVQQAVMNGSENITRALLDLDAALDIPDGQCRWTPLFWAAIGGHEAVARLLLDRGAQSNTRDDHNRTPISWAAENGHEAIVKLLVERGAEFDIKSEPEGWTPLSLASENGHEGIVRLLLDLGVNFDLKDEKSGWTPLSLAAENGHEKVAQLLIDRGADIDAIDDEYGRTPLSWAARNGHVAVVRLLLNRGAEVESKDTKHGRRALTWAAENGHTTVTQQLLDKGAILDAPDDTYGRTPLSWAAENGQTSVIRLLLDQGAELELKDRRNQTPLLWAAKNGHEATTQLLLDQSVEIDVTDKTGRTPLSWAAGNGHTVIVRLLLDRGARRNTEDEKYNRTPLLWAVGNGHETVVQLLLD